MKIYILKFVNAIQLNKFNLSTFFLVYLVKIIPEMCRAH